MPAKQCDYLSTICRIRSIIPMAPDNFLFEFSDPDGTFSDCKPGQFLQLWIPGVGECPISVCSSRVNDFIQLTVRRVGRVTNALFQMKEGDRVGLRGPYGVGFPVEKWQNQNICMIAGGLGIAPIRSLLEYVLDHRQRFGNVTLIYGMRHSTDLLFRDEMKFLMLRRDIEIFIAAEEIVGPGLPPVAVQLGRVTDMVRQTNLLPDTEVAICGPPIMYPYVIQELHKKHIDDSSIWLSLERHMKCGIGKCGHCFIGGVFTCKAGPVFQLSRLGFVPEVIECGK